MNNFDPDKYLEKTLETRVCIFLILYPVRTIQEVEVKKEKANIDHTADTITGIFQPL